MWARTRFDVDWSDLAFGLRACLATSDVEARQRRVEERWSSTGDALAC